MVATLRRVRMEVPYHRRPWSRRWSRTYRWYDGYQVIDPDGRPQFPYMRCLEARQFCREQGWKYTVEA